MSEDADSATWYQKFKVTIVGPEVVGAFSARARAPLCAPPPAAPPHPLLPPPSPRANICAGRVKQPYHDGLFQVEVIASDGFFDHRAENPADAPRIKFLTRVWHPFVDYGTGAVCHEFWSEYYRQRLPAAPSLTNFAVTLQSFLANVHTDADVCDAVAVNADAMRGLKEGGGEGFDDKANEVTTKYAKET